MSDTMLLGVLRMPYHALDTESGRIQYYQRGLQAADEIERLRARDQEWAINSCLKNPDGEIGVWR